MVLLLLMMGAGPWTKAMIPPPDRAAPSSRASSGDAEGELRRFWNQGLSRPLVFAKNHIMLPKEGARLLPYFTGLKNCGDLYNANKSAKGFVKAVRKKSLDDGNKKKIKEFLGHARGVPEDQIKDESVDLFHYVSTFPSTFFYPSFLGSFFLVLIPYKAVRLGLVFCAAAHGPFLPLAHPRLLAFPCYHSFLGMLIGTILPDLGVNAKGFGVLSAALFVNHLDGFLWRFRQTSNPEEEAGREAGSAAEDDASPSSGL